MTRAPGKCTVHLHAFCADVLKGKSDSIIHVQEGYQSTICPCDGYQAMNFYPMQMPSSGWEFRFPAFLNLLAYLTCTCYAYWDKLCTRMYVSTAQHGTMLASGKKWRCVSPAQKGIKWAGLEIQVRLFSSVALKQWCCS